jgi:hypothetical protein
VLGQFWGTFSVFSVLPSGFSTAFEVSDANAKKIASVSSNTTSGESGGNQPDEGANLHLLSELARTASTTPETAGKSIMETWRFSSVCQSWDWLHDLVESRTRKRGIYPKSAYSIAVDALFENS